jgi:hypothetical protein
MKRPGDRLRECADRFFSRTTMDRVVDPAVADLQAEYHAALRSGSIWRPAWAMLVGYFACVKVITLCACFGPAAALRDNAADDRRAFVRTIVISAGAIVVASALLNVFPWLVMSRRLSRLSQHVSTGQRIWWLVYCIPSALVLAGPIGFSAGLAISLGGRVVSQRLKIAIIGIALVCSFGALANQEWIVPAANNAFRVQMSPPIRSALWITDLNSMSRSELSEAMKSLREVRDVPGPELSSVAYARFAYAYALHFRWAMSIVVVVLAVFILAVVGRRSVQRWKLIAIILAAFVSYYYLLQAGRMLGREADLPALAAAWLPNAILILISATTTAMTRRPQS